MGNKGALSLRSFFVFLSYFVNDSLMTCKAVVNDW